MFMVVNYDDVVDGVGSGCMEADDGGWWLGFF